MKMRELEQRTGVSRQMIQYYLRNGMLPEPARPKPNVAIYNEQHVTAIKSIRHLQTEGRLKIEEIKQLLKGKKGKLAPSAAAFPHLDELFAAHAGLQSGFVALSSLKTRNPKAESDAEILQKVGAVELVNKRGKTYLSHIDAEIVACWGDMRNAGATEEIGIDPWFTAIHVELAKRLATGEVEYFLERVPQDLPRERKAEIAHNGSKVTLALFTLLRMKAAVNAFKFLSPDE